MRQNPERPPNLRRAYFESRYGQLHCRTGFPSTGGFDELTPLVGLHDAPGTSSSLAPLLPTLGRDRSVYLPDLPGCGQSDPPPAPPTIGEYAVAVGEMLRSLRLREVDLFGIGAGAAVAVELALWMGKGVRRVVLARAPVEPASPGPIPPCAADGSHVIAEWAVGLMPGADAAALARHTREVGERLAGGETARWPVNALARWPAREQLSRVDVPLLLLQASAPAAGILPPGARVDTRVPALDRGPDGADRTVRALRDFLDAG